MDKLEHAHELRHRSEADRLAGQNEAALAAAAVAVSIYRSADDRLLDLANALRLEALALDALERSGEAAMPWREARDLYSGLGVTEGVTECDTYLNG